MLFFIFFVIPLCFLLLVFMGSYFVGKSIRESIKRDMIEAIKEGTKHEKD